MKRLIFQIIPHNVFFPHFHFSFFFFYSVHTSSAVSMEVLSNDVDSYRLRLIQGIDFFFFFAFQSQTISMIYSTQLTRRWCSATVERWPPHPTRWDVVSAGQQHIFIFIIAIRFPRPGQSVAIVHFNQPRISSLICTGTTFWRGCRHLAIATLVTCVGSTK